MKRRIVLIIGMALAILTLVLPVVQPAYALPAQSAQALLDPLTIPKYENQLTGPLPVYEPTLVMSNGKVVKYEYNATMSAFMEQMLPPSMNLLTPVWGFGGLAEDAVTGAPLGYVQSAPGLTFETTQGIPVQVEWVNNITTPYMFPVDPTLHWANPNNYPAPTPPFSSYPSGYQEVQTPVPLVIHLHGSETQSYYDGGPDAWFTNSGLHGPTYYTYEKCEPNAAVDYYPNVQPPTMLWYHDHTLGVTRIDMYSGLAGLYIINQPNSTIDDVAPVLPTGKYDMPLVIQDKTFYANGSLYFPTVGTNPNINPYWYGGFLGDTNTVNGKVWPNMNVDQGQYRFQLLIASDVRVYNLTFFDTATNTYLPFTQIGTDGGYLKSATDLTSLEIGPAERADVLVDFSGLPAGSKILLENTLVFNSSEAQTIGQVMQFTVTGKDGFKPETLPTLLNPTLAGPFPNLPTPTNTRIFPLFLLNGPSGPDLFLINGQSWDAPPVKIKVGTTEDWEFVDLTDMPHEIHLHLIQFQIVSRQAINATEYATNWIALQRTALGNANAVPPWPTNFIPEELPIQPYLIGNATPAPPNEQGWKDTVLTQPYTVTIIRVRFAQQDGSPFPFDATKGPGYVFHCHMLDHEDNMMMLRYQLVSPSSPNTLILIASAILIFIVVVAVLFLFLRRRRLKREKANTENWTVDTGELNDSLTFDTITLRDHFSIYRI